VNVPKVSFWLFFLDQHENEQKFATIRGNNRSRKPMSYLQKKASKKREKHLLPQAATADSPLAQPSKPNPKAFTQSKSFFGRRSGTR